jgi:tetratricopeptide (TPR) repeat protein
MMRVLKLMVVVMGLHWAAGAAAQTAAAPPPPPGGAGPAEDPHLADARNHFEAGKNLYNVGDYLEAIREFKAAEALRSSPILSYNIGLANEQLGRKKVAVKYFRRYLEGLPSASNRPEVEANIAALEREIAAQTPPPSSAPPPPVVEAPVDSPPPPPPAGYPAYDPYATNPAPAPVAPQPVKKKSHWWVSLIIVGGALAIAGTIAAAVLLTGSTTTRSFDRSVPGLTVSRPAALPGLQLRF